jgi:hypothetical protein
VTRQHVTEKQDREEGVGVSGLGTWRAWGRAVWLKEEICVTHEKRNRNGLADPRRDHGPIGGGLVRPLGDLSNDDACN